MAQVYRFIISIFSPEKQIAVVNLQRWYNTMRVVGAGKDRRQDRTYNVAARILYGDCHEQHVRIRTMRGGTFFPRLVID